MKKYMSWYSVDAGMAGDPKIDCMPDNDYRWSWLCLLGLEKKGELEGQNVQMFAKHCNVEAEKFGHVLKALRDVGLLDEYNRPREFQEWQDKAQRASRNKRYYNTHKAGSDSDGIKTVVRLSETETENDTDRNKNKKAGKPAGVCSPEIKKGAERVLEHLNRKTGRTFKRTADIQACLKREGCTVRDCTNVIDFKVNQWKGTEMERNINPTTPFRNANFSRYLDEAGAGSGSVATSDTRPRGEDGRVIQQWELDMMAETEQEQK